MSEHWETERHTVKSRILKCLSSENTDNISASGDTERFEGLVRIDLGKDQGEPGATEQTNIHVDPTAESTDPRKLAA